MRLTERASEMTMSRELWLDPIFEVLHRWDHLASVRLENGSELLGHVPHVAELAYFHRIPAALPNDRLAEKLSRFRTKIPADLICLYRRANGLSLFNDTLSVLGFRENHQRSDFLAASAQPYSVDRSDRYERARGLQHSDVIVGVYGPDVHYLVSGSSDQVFLCPRNDGTHVIERWVDFRTMLTDLVQRLAKQ